MRVDLRISLVATAAALLAACTMPAPVVNEERIQQVILSSFSSFEYKYSPEIIARLTPDEGQTMCSAVRNDIAKIPPAQLNASLEKWRKEVKYPAGGKLMGDWKQGEQVAQSGYGLRFGTSPDEPKRANGGNCYACHQVAPQELAFGTIGPSLLGYGKSRGTSEAMQRFVYEKVYNAWIYFPCSFMPRFGHHQVLTPEQLTHVVALLLDPASPVNK